MDKFNLEAYADKIKSVGVKTASALRELLSRKEEETAGTLDAKGRIERLFDAGTFSQIGTYVRRRNDQDNAADDYDFESVICGWGAVNGRLVYAFSQDMSRSAGSVSETHARKICELYRLAMENGAPVVGIFDSAGAYIPDGVRVMAGYGKIMKAVSAASGIIPQIAVAAGNVSGAAAVICGMFDIVIKTDDASLSVNPAFNTDAKGMADMGVTAVKTADAASAVAAAREILAYLPSNNCEETPEDISSDNANRAVTVASDDACEIIKAFADNGKLVELYADYAPEAVGGFVSVGGVSVGVVATNKSVNGGRLTAASVRKAARLVSLFDSFNIPTVTLVDSEGIDNSAASESSPFAAELAKLAGAYASATAPMITVITGEAYGSVYTVLGSKALGADIVYALDNMKEYLVDGLFAFRGFAGVISYVNGEAVYAYINDGTRIGGAITDAKPAHTGTVAAITRELTLDNTLELSVNMSDEEINDLSGKWIYIDNDKVQNGAYMIEKAKRLNNGNVLIDIGITSVIRSYKDKNDTTKGFICNVEEGQAFRIPLSRRYEK